jgi:hypothetical protein
MWLTSGCKAGTIWIDEDLELLRLKRWHEKGTHPLPMTATILPEGLKVESQDAECNRVPLYLSISLIAGHFHLLIADKSLVVKWQSETYLRGPDALILH